MQMRVLGISLMAFFAAGVFLTAGTLAEPACPGEDEVG